MVRKFSMGAVGLLCIAGGFVPNACVSGQTGLLSGYSPSTVGYLVIDAQSGAVLSEHNSTSLLVPASVTKCVTGAAAYEILGQDFRFTTNVYAGGGFDSDSSLVKGDLYIRGGGDPGFLAERLWLFVKQLQHRGVQKIEGDLVVDGSFFDSSRVGPGFDEDRSSRAYVAPVAALSASFNTLAVHCRPGSRAGSAVFVDLFPPVDNIPVTNTARTYRAGEVKGVQVNSSENAELTAISVSGGLAQGSQPRYVYRRIWNANEHFGHVILTIMRENGVVVKGGVRTGVVPDSVVSKGAILSFESQPLAEFVGHMFKYSSNFAAEMLFRTMSVQAGRKRNGSWQDGGEVVRDWWRRKGLPDSLHIVNGSGMGSVNRLSAAQVCALLSYVLTRSDYWPDYCAALSIGGVDGTIKDRFTRSPLKGAIRGKTGTLNSLGASSLAGYYLDGGVKAVFAVIVNNTAKGQYEHWTLQQKILEAALIKRN